MLAGTLAATGPPLPDPTAPPKPVTRKLRAESPKAVADSSRPNLALVVVPQQTNYLEYYYCMPCFYGMDGKLNLITNQMWIWVQRFDPVKHAWTNVWSGPLPTNYVIDFISVAPKGSVPKYKFTASFQNNTN